MYDCKIKGNPRKLETTWLGAFVIEDIKPNGIIQSRILQGKLLNKVVNDT